MLCSLSYAREMFILGLDYRDDTAHMRAGSSQVIAPLCVLIHSSLPALCLKSLLKIVLISTSDCGVVKNETLSALHGHSFL